MDTVPLTTGNHAARRQSHGRTISAALLAVALLAALTACNGGAGGAAGGASTADPVDVEPVGDVVGPNFAYEFWSYGIQIFPVDPDTGEFGTVLPPLNGTDTTTIDLEGLDPGVIDARGKFLFVTRNFGPDVAVVSGFTLNATTGVPTPTAQGSINIDATNGTNTSPFGTLIDPTGKFLYVGSQGNDGTDEGSFPFSPGISAYSIDRATGALTEIDGSPYPLTRAFTMAMDPAGKFLFVSTGDTSPPDNLLTFAIDPATGALTAGPTTSAHNPNGEPFVMGIDPTGTYLYTIDLVAGLGNTEISEFTISSTDGTLTPTDSAAFILSAHLFPGGIAFDATGEHAYIGLAGIATNTLLTFDIDETGNLTVDASSPHSPFNGAGDGVDSATLAPIGKFMYLASNQGGADGYSVADDGTLTHIAGFPITGQNDTTVLISPKLQ